jgi:hypothetical protein
MLRCRRLLLLNDRPTCLLPSPWHTWFLKKKAIFSLSCIGSTASLVLRSPSLLLGPLAAGSKPATPGRRPGRPLPPPAKLTAAGCGAPPCAAHDSLAEPARAHLAHAYPVRRSRSGTRPCAAHDGRDGIPHADEASFSQATKRYCAETTCCKHLFQMF